MRLCLRLITYVQPTHLTVLHNTYNAIELPFTCSNSAFVCATNTLLGVHGCCDPATLSACTIPTTCIASTALSTICTDSTCSNDPYVLHCSAPSSPECVKWLVAYSKTTMTQHGCGSVAFTSAAERGYGGASSVANVLERTVTVEVTPSVTPTPTSIAKSGESKKTNLGAIVGATVGGCTALSVLILAFIIVRRQRRRNAAAEGHVVATTTGYLPPTSPPMATNGIDAHAHPYGYPPNDVKAWQLHNAGPVTRVSDAIPAYPHMGAGRYGVVEVDGVQRPVEVEAGWHRRS